MAKKKKDDEPVDIIAEAYDVINSHSYPICYECGRKCKSVCLLLELFLQVLELDKSGRGSALERLQVYFEPDYGDDEEDEEE